MTLVKQGDHSHKKRMFLSAKNRYISIKIDMYNFFHYNL